MWLLVQKSYWSTFALKSLERVFDVDRAAVGQPDEFWQPEVSVTGVPVSLDVRGFFWCIAYLPILHGWE